MTYQFKGTSFLENTPQLRNIFFKGISAKEFLLESLDDEHDLHLVRATPTWGLEPSVIWALSKHFNVFSLEKKGVLVATLMEDLDKEAWKYLNTIEIIPFYLPKKGTKKGESKARKKRARGLNPPERVDAEPAITGDSINGSKPKPDKVFEMGRILLNWLLNKELISIYQSDVDIKTGEGYILKPSYARALFDIKLLPLNVTLPMVHPPLDWEIRRPVRSGPDQADQKDQRRLGDLTGGYLYSDPKLGGGHSREAPALSSHDETKFYIRLQGDPQTRQLTRVLNKLQGVPFQINGLFLQKLHEDWDQLQKYGLVMPKILDSINRKEGLRRLNTHYMKDDDILENFTFRELSKVLIKTLWRLTTSNMSFYLRKLIRVTTSIFLVLWTSGDEITAMAHSIFMNVI